MVINDVVTAGDTVELTGTVAAGTRVEGSLTVIQDDQTLTATGEVHTPIREDLIVTANIEISGSDELLKGDPSDLIRTINDTLNLHYDKIDARLTQSEIHDIKLVIAGIVADSLIRYFAG